MPPPRNGLFPTTRWTVVRRMRDGETSVRFPAWDDFVRTYRRPLEVWLRTRCGNDHLAEELVQGFLVKIHLRKSAERLDPERGRLRSWLLVSLRHHWLNHLRGEHPHSELDESSAGSIEEVADAEFDREWAWSVGRLAIARIEAEYRARGSGELFEVLLRLLDEPEDAAPAGIAASLGMLPNTFAVARMRFRERIALRLREEVAATLTGDDPAEIDAELKHFIHAVARHGGLGPMLADAAK